MPFTFTFPSEYGYVLAVATASTFISIFHTTRTAGLRTAARVDFPNPYATAAEAASNPAKFQFNCAQKAHANFSENHPSFVIVLLIAGLSYPTASAVLGASWVVARVLYAIGYTRKENAEKGKGRHLGTWWALPHLILMGLAGVSSWKVWSS